MHERADERAGKQCDGFYGKEGRSSPRESANEGAAQCDCEARSGGQVGKAKAKVKSETVPCSECGAPVPIAGPEDRTAGVMCLECAEGAASARWSNAKLELELELEPAQKKLIAKLRAAGVMLDTARPDSTRTRLLQRGRLRGC